MPRAAPADSPSVVFKGRMMTLTVLELHSDDIDRIGADIDTQIAKAPDFFTRMPVLLSIVGPLPDLESVQVRLRTAGLMVAGLLNADGPAAEAAAAAGLGVTQSQGQTVDQAIGASAAERPAAQPASAARKTTGAAPEAQSARETQAIAARVVDRPVRSGQQIYARGGDLIVLESVSAGAEIIADGHIHVYSTLRGRALAGAGGNREARIFCRRFEPDLVAIAGCYKVADAIDDSARGRAVQVWLDDDSLIIQPQE